MDTLYYIVNTTYIFPVLNDCGCISFKLKHNAVKHYMCFGLAYFFYDVYAMYIVFKVTSNANSGTLKVRMFF